MSEVFCMGSREEALIGAGRKGFWCSKGFEPPNLGKKSGGPPTPRRPAFAFLFTPKLPLGGRSGKIYFTIGNRFAIIVKEWRTILFGSILNN
ncbi:MAG: hypothetical protein ABSF76_17515 [Opitutaceae bacterium]